MRSLRHFEIGDEQLVSLIRRFNQIQIVAVLWLFSRILDIPWPINSLRMFGLDLSNYVTVIPRVLFALAMILPILSLFFLKSRIVRFLASTVFFLFVSAAFSLGRSVHDFYGILFASLWLSFIDLGNTDSLSKLRNRFFFWAAQVSFLGIYFLSGLWKLRSLVEFYFERGFASTNPLATNLGWNSIQQFADVGKTTWAFDFPAMFFALWIGVIVFEVGAPLVAWRPQLQPVYGIAIVLFHIATYAMMGIHYAPAAMLGVLMLCFTPYRPK